MIGSNSLTHTKISGPGTIFADAIGEVDSSTIPDPALDMLSDSG